MSRARAITLLTLTSGLLFASGFLVGNVFQSGEVLADSQKASAETRPKDFIYPKLVKTIQIKPDTPADE